MKPLKRCLVEIPEPLLRAVEESEKRKNEAMDRLAGKLAEHLPAAAPLDNFGTAMEALIDADKAALLTRGK